MKIKFGAFVTDGRGKIGGTVYSKNKWGAFARNLVQPINPNTTYQQSQRNQFNTTVQAWNALSDVDKKLWTDYALIHPRTDVFGTVYYLTGQTMMLSVNQHLFNISAPSISVPGTDDVPTEDWSFTVDPNTTGAVLDINTSFAPNNANNFVEVFATPPMSTGRTSATTQYRRITRLNASGAAGYSIASAYIDKYGALPTIGEKVFVKLLQVDDRSGLTGVEFWNSEIAY